MKHVPWLPWLAAALAVAIGLARWLRVRRYRRWFRIPVRRDDSLPCRGNHRTLSLSADRDGFAMPAGVVARGQTAFLALQVSTTPLGGYVDPFIEVGRGRRRYRQYFERGATGQRHLNLSPLFQNAIGAGFDRIHLRGGAIRWKREASLIVFDPPPVGNATILVLAPHPDDAEIATFGLYAGRPSWVATITAGERGMADLSAVAPGPSDAARWKALVRVWDSLTIPQLGDVPPDRCLNLVYPDGQLQALFLRAPPRAMLACEKSLSRAALRRHNQQSEFQSGDPACTWEGLVEELRRLLEVAKPDIVVCPHPIVDAHHDHVFTTVALEQAIRQTPLKRPLFFLYVVHRRDVPLHPLGPNTSWVSFPPWTDVEWLADSIYSHPLAPKLQAAKYFAVEGMHDLRTFSADEPRGLAQVLRVVIRELLAWGAGTGLPATSYLRRAPRPNEIYGVVSADSLSELVQRALERSPADRN
ncbi:MAG: PIG-L family deacetylase [Polyangiaceae bacterium]|jgi:LmbE family N-acetylglucosaminyl deacetylase